MEPSFEVEINRFVDRIESMRVMLPIMVKFISEANKNTREDFERFLSDNNIESDEKDGKTIYLVSPEKSADFRKLEREIRSAELACTFVPPSFLVALISQYDAYLGRLIRVIFKVKSELLSSSDRQLTFSDLSSFENVEDAKESIIEKEIETVLRKNHADQIKWLENKLDMTLTKDLDIWPTFIEVTERRNLFVHTDGVISRQYINVCKKHGVELGEDIENFKKLSVSLSYFQNACNCVFEMGVKLANVFWRKLMSEDREAADKNLNALCHNLICTENYALATKLLEFATVTLKKHSSEHIALLFTINKAQALKWSGKEGECRDVLGKVDWSAKGLEFKLARSVLEENYEDSVLQMKSIGKNGEVSKIDYSIQPIYQKFRRSDLFLATYEEIFGEKFDNSTNAQGKIELTTEECSFNGTGRDIDQFKFDVKQCLESGIRKCCVGNEKFPPLEIASDENGQYLLRFIINFEPSEEILSDKRFAIIIHVNLISVEDLMIDMKCSGVITEKDFSEEMPSYETSFFEGKLDEGLIWNELDKILFQIWNKAQEQMGNKADTDAIKEPIWITL
jgi:hypothetical protein